ncbi:hypothetical protein [Roseovarius salinarum]|uniref:hypothetical protein n=1 Tax=Roseovarius salinarum TaxID=1981892 RepID=UPI0012FFFA58|nr:hypothetical protein [Roseovarius salinarum]
MSTRYRADAATIVDDPQSVLGAPLPDSFSVATKTEFIARNDDFFLKEVIDQIPPDGPVTEPVMPVLGPTESNGDAFRKINWDWSPVPGTDWSNVPGTDWSNLSGKWTADPVEEILDGTDIVGVKLFDGTTPEIYDKSSPYLDELPPEIFMKYVFAESGDDFIFTPPESNGSDEDFVKIDFMKFYLPPDASEDQASGTDDAFLKIDGIFEDFHKISDPDAGGIPLDFETGINNLAPDFDPFFV